MGKKSKPTEVSLVKITTAILVAKAIPPILRGIRRLLFRWRRLLAPLWTGTAVWFLSVLARWHGTGWAWVVLVLPVLGISLAVLGPRLTDRVRTWVMVLVPEGLDRGSNGVLDRPVERIFLAVLLSWTGTYMAVRIGDGPSPLSGTLWQAGVFGLGGIWWWHRRVRVAGRADKYARRWRKITEGTTKAMELRILAGSKPVAVESRGAMACLRIRLAEGVTAEQVTRSAESLASFFNMRPKSVFPRKDEASARHIWFMFLPRDPWKAKIAHLMPAPASTSLVELGFTFVMGVLADASDLRYRLQHTLIVGQSGSGKSVWLESLLIWLLACRDVVIIGIDLAGGATLGMWRRVLAMPLATDPDQGRWTLERVLAVIQDRERQLGLEKEESDDAGDEFQPSPDRPWIVVVIDEFPDLIAAGENEVIKLLGRIGKRARKCGVRLVFLSQNGSKEDLGSKELQAQLRAIVGLGLNSHASRVLWGTLEKEGWNSAGLRNGQFLLRDDDHTAPSVAKGAYVSPRDRRAIISAAVEAGRPALEPTAQAALTGTGGFVIDMPVEPAEKLPPVVEALRDSGPYTGDELAALPGMPSRATVFRHLKEAAERGQVHRVGGKRGMWHYGQAPADEPARVV